MCASKPTVFNSGGEVRPVYPSTEEKQSILPV